MHARFMRRIDHTSQTSLSSFAAPQAILAGPYDCSTCKQNKGLFDIGGKQKVKCGLSGLRNIPNGCGGYDDGDPMAGWPPLADNYETPKKWRKHE
jgi:hypothetical protein